MPRRAQTARKEKYAPTLSRTTDKIVVKLMMNGKKGLAERILRQALARAEASARRVGGATYQVAVEIRGDRRMNHGVREIVQAASARAGTPVTEKPGGEPH